MDGFLLVCFLLHFRYLVVHGQCTEERSQNGFALLNSNYSSKIVNGYQDCVDLCFDDYRCKSFNFWWDIKTCDLNNNSREYHLSCYVHEATVTYMGMGRLPKPESCSSLKEIDSSAKSGMYIIDPDGPGGEPQFTVTCNMSGVGVTVIGHDSEGRILVDGFEEAGSYLRDIHYKGASLSQLVSLIRVSLYCEQFIKYECYGSRILRGKKAWWVSRDSVKMTYWGGASPGSGKCACGMTNSCADSSYGCNCDKNDKVWREDSGRLTDKSHLPVTQLRFGDTGNEATEKGYHILGKFKCYGIF